MAVRPVPRTLQRSRFPFEPTEHIGEKATGVVCTERAAQLTDARKPTSDRTVLRSRQAGLPAAPPSSPASVWLVITALVCMQRQLSVVSATPARPARTFYKPAKPASHTYRVPPLRPTPVTASQSYYAAL